jgi:hypothetical protein
MNNIFKYKSLVFIAVIALIVFIASGIPFSLFSKLFAEKEYNNIYMEYENMNQNINMKGIYEESQNNLLKKINDLNIDTEILQDEIIIELSHISGKNNIELSSIKFSEAIPVLTDNTALCMKVTVEFNSELNNMLKFIDDVKNSETIISVADISVLTSENKAHVSLNLLYYALPMI